MVKEQIIEVEVINFFISTTIIIIIMVKQVMLMINFILLYTMRMI